MIHGIHHAAISTPDMERALGFYRDLLGAIPVNEFAWPRGTEFADRVVGVRDSAARVVMLRLGNAMIELFEYDSPPPRVSDPERRVCDHGITHLCVSVTDIDAEYERLKSAGVLFNCPPQDLGTTRVTYGHDPDGNVVELHEVVDPASPVSLGVLPTE